VGLETQRKHLIIVNLWKIMQLIWLLCAGRAAKVPCCDDGGVKKDSAASKPLVASWVAMLRCGL
jgi:hypothetical protein